MRKFSLFLVIFLIVSCGQSIIVSNDTSSGSTEISLCGGKEYETSTYFCDARDEQIYKWVKIGTQIWMAENIRHEDSKSRCYGDDLNNCAIFGKMYDWNTAKTICPSGWHLPNDTEWIALASFVEKNSNCSNCAGAKLKANSSLWVSGKGTDNFGFTALPGGYHRNAFDSFYEKGAVAGFWSATTGSTSGSAHFRYFKNINATLNLEGFYISEAFANVRCVKNI